MTNEQKYKTPANLAEQFIYDHGYNYTLEEVFEWLKREADEKPLPCPFCGENPIIEQFPNGGKIHVCCECGYGGIYCDTKYIAIAEHNKIAKKCEVM